VVGAFTTAITVKTCQSSVTTVNVHSRHHNMPFTRVSNLKSQIALGYVRDNGIGPEWCTSLSESMFSVLSERLKILIRSFIFYILHFPVPEIPVQIGPLFTRSCIFHPELFGPSFSKSGSFTPCYYGPSVCILRFCIFSAPIVTLGRHMTLQCSIVWLRKTLLSV